MFVLDSRSILDAGHSTGPMTHVVGLRKKGVVSRCSWEMSTPKLNHKPIAMHLVDRGIDRNHASPLKRRGDFYWINHGEQYWRDHNGAYWKRVSEDSRILVLAMPDNGRWNTPTGIDDWQYTEWTVNHENTGGHSWSAGGSVESPTLSPSLHAVGIWHGWVTGGRLIEA